MTAFTCTRCLRKTQDRHWVNDDILCNPCNWAYLKKIGRLPSKLYTPSFVRSSLPAIQK